MAKVRITAYCQGCESYIDTTLHATRALRMLQGFQAAHDAACFEEETDGQEEAGSASGAPGTSGGTEEGTSSGPAGTKVH